MSMLRKMLEELPRPDIGRFAHMTDAELEKYCAELDGKPKTDLRKFVETVEAHPGCLSSWDMDIPFEEFARRVRAGEYD